MNVENIKKTNIEIYSNPFNLSTNTKLNYNAKGCKIIIYNILGQKVKEIQIQNQSFINIERGELPDGVYFLNLIENNLPTMTLKILLSRN